MNAVSLLKSCHDWNDFRQQVAKLGSKEKGDSFEALSKYYLQLHPEYITTLKNVWWLEEVLGFVVLRKNRALIGRDYCL
jgi:predicted helicase